MAQYLILFAVVLGVNLMPAFGPPTWSVIVMYGINTKLPAVALVPIAAFAAVTGRFLLAHAFRMMAGHVSAKTKRNVAAAREAFERRKRNSMIAVGLFALAPIPSAPLFEAAGLAKVPLLGFTAAFFAERTISYSVYLVAAKSFESTSIGEMLRHSITSPLGIAIQVGMIALLVGFTRIDWARWIGHPTGG